MKHVSLLMVTMLFASSAAVAQKTPAHDTNAPIAISSDRFVADSNAKTGTFQDNVIITQGDIKMRADSVRVTTTGRSDQPDKIYANGHVVVDSPNTGTVTGDEGVYDVGPRLVTLTGHVVLNKEKKGVMSGSQLTVNLVTGVAQVTGKGTPTGRVQGLFTPPPQSANPSANPGGK